MKILTFVVPCYNSESYMRRCIDSLLPGGDDVEIIIVNDGSTDATWEIAAEYEANYPGIVRAVQKENGGHGSGVNTGIALASGKYFKVVDSDDWVDAEAYAHVILPEHTFYVDNLFAYVPLPYVKTIRYMSVDFYQYFLGRDDQSVNEQVMMKRIDQQIRVTRLVAESVDLEKVKKEHPKLANYMRRNISIMMAISSIHLLLIHTDEAFAKRKKLWEDIHRQNAALYYRLRFATLSGLTYLPGSIGAKLTVSGYGLAKKIYQFQ